jgi:hypothetical protein
MAQVVKNPDNTLTVTLSPLEQRVLVRWAADRASSVAAQFADALNGIFANKINDYRSLDGPSLLDRYNALTPAKQAQIDTILGV